MSRRASVANIAGIDPGTVSQTILSTSLPSEFSRFRQTRESSWEFLMPLLDDSGYHHVHWHRNVERGGILGRERFLYRIIYMSVSVCILLIISFVKFCFFIYEIRILFVLQCQIITLNDNDRFENFCNKKKVFLEIYIIRIEWEFNVNLNAELVGNMYLIERLWERAQWIIKRKYYFVIFLYDCERITRFYVKLTWMDTW